MSTDQGTEKRQRQKEVLTTARPFNREKFLLILLSSIFAYQASIFAFGVWSCTRVTPQQNITEICPDLGTRYDQTFSVMIATTLALLTGGAAVTLTQRKPSLDDRVSSVQEKQGVRQPYPPQPKE